MVLVDGNGNATYVERTMDENANAPDEAEWRLSNYEFDVFQETGDYMGYESKEAKNRIRETGMCDLGTCRNDP